MSLSWPQRLSVIKSGTSPVFIHESWLPFSTVQVLISKHSLTFSLAASFSFPANRDVSSKCSGNDLNEEWGGRKSVCVCENKSDKIQLEAPELLSDWPSQMQDLQQQLLVLLVLLRSAGVQLKGRLLEKWQSFSQSSQLYQVQEVEVSEPFGPLVGCQLWIKTLSELGHVVTPLLLKPGVCRTGGWLMVSRSK